VGHLRDSKEQGGERGTGSDQTSSIHRKKNGGLIILWVFGDWAAQKSVKKGGESTALNEGIGSYLIDRFFKGHRVLEGKPEKYTTGKKINGGEDEWVAHKGRREKREDYLKKY